jgi:hypothetical protein
MRVKNRNLLLYRLSIYSYLLIFFFLSINFIKNEHWNIKGLGEIYGVITKQDMIDVGNIWEQG